MDKRDRTGPSLSTHRTSVSNGNERSVNEGHKTTAATLAKVAAVQEQSRKTSGETERQYPHPKPATPPKDSQPRRDPASTHSKMAPSTTATGTTIQRIAEFGAPPLKVSTATTPTNRVPRKATAKETSRALSKSDSPPGVLPPSLQRLENQAASPPSPVNSTVSPSAPARHGPYRSTSQEGGLFSKVKEGKKQLQSDGLKAASFLGKVSHQAWDKLKKQGMGPRNPSSSSLPSQAGSTGSSRDTSNDIDVFGMDLKEAVAKTRIVRDRKAGGDAAYWMPAIAYRCLQYLNVHGPHEIGIYRIPGSTSVVDDLRTDFKIRHDVDLFDNPPDDVHTVSSLLKGWFRSLPDAILPQDVQRRIYEKCKDDTEAPRPPQAFVDEISRLPPYNYYLLHHLFSHLSTICLESDINKMNVANLGMIFCSTLRMDRYCFNWFVGSWADCWAGCLTEEEEYERTAPRRNPSNASSSRHMQPSPDSRSTSRTGKSEVDRWPSTGSRSRHNKSPATRSPSRDAREKRDDTDREREREKRLERDIIDRAKEREKMHEREQERDKAKARSEKSKECSPERKYLPMITSEPDDRFSMMVETNGTPRQSLASTKSDTLDMPILPPKPVSPMMKG